MSALKTPRAVVRALELLLPSDRREDVIGDLEELHQRRRARLGALAAAAVTTINSVWIALAFLIIWLREKDWSLRLLSRLEFLLAVRLLRKQPFLSATAVVSLAAGIAVSAIGFTMVDQMLNGSLPMQDGDRFVRFDVRTQAGEQAQLNGDHFRLLQQQTAAFEHIGAISAQRSNVRHGAGSIETVGVARITPSSLMYLDDVPLLGRALLESDAAIGAPPAAVIRAAMWQRMYRSSASALGGELSIAGSKYEIVGVMPDTFLFPSGGEVWLPHSIEPAGTQVLEPLSLFGILAPGTDAASAEVEINSLANLVHSPEAASQVEARDRLAIGVQRFTEVPGPIGIQRLIGVLVPLLVVLVIALNVANLVQARTASRTRELSVRTVLGAPRARLIAQLTLESALMGSLAAALGTGCAVVALRWIDAAITEAPYWIDLTASPRTFGFAILVALLVAAVCGALPALRATRVSLQQTIASGGQAFDVSRFGAAMMVTQMALAVALLSGALVMARGLWSAAGSDLELPDQQVLTAQITTPPPSADDERLPAPERVARAIAEIPGVLASGTADHLPRYDAPASAIEVEARGGNGALGAAGQATRAMVSEGFLESLRARLVAGRLLVPEDFAIDAGAVTVVNEPFVARFFGGSNPVGARFRTLAENTEEGHGPWLKIVGVVPDLGLGGGAEEFAAGYYTPGHTSRRYFYLSLLSASGPETLAPSLRSSLLELDPELVVSRVQLLSEVNGEERAFQAGMGATLSAIGVLALVLSLLGLYAMISLSITQRTREIGVRLALGASRVGVLRSVLRRAGRTLLLGGVIGTGLGLAFVRLQDQMLAARLPAGEPWILPVVLAAFAVAGTAACVVPALRAQRISPTQALKAD